MEALPGKHVWCLRKRKDTGPLTRRDMTHARCGGTWARKAEDRLRPHRDMKHYPKGKGSHLKQSEVMVGSELQEDHFGGGTEKEVNGGKQSS